MTHPDSNPIRPGVRPIERFKRAVSPIVGERVQLLAAATMWLIGAGILLVRGAGYLQGRSWHAWALAAGLALGVLKARMILDRAARAAVARIYERGRAHFFGFFSARSWALVAVMMGAGMVLRRLVVHPDAVGAGIMGALYIGVGTALLLADRAFWHAFAGRLRVGEA
ncbi:MAG: hypothetical protein QMC79_03070 [Anaerosomatales bacterium]|nr:hypothetical protein [Anaerosomatales bacterium]